MKQIYLFLLLILSTFLVGQSSPQEDKVIEAREQLIKYGIDSSLVPLIYQLQTEGETYYNALLLERLETTRDKDLIIGILNLFKETKTDSAKEIALNFVEEESATTRLSLITDALSYLTTVFPNDTYVKDLLWDIIANTAQPDKSRLVVVALQAWKTTGDTSKGQELIDLYESDDYPNEPKSTIIWLLGEMKDPLALDLVREIASNDSEEPYLRSVAIKSQLEIQGESALEEIEPYLSEGNSRIRIAVIEGIAGFSSPEAYKILENALRDNDVNIRLKAITAIGLKKNSQAVEILTYRLKTESEERVQRTALLALIEINTPEARNMVGEVFSDSRYSESLRFIALSALLKNDRNSLTPLLLKAISKENLGFPSSFVINLAAKMAIEKGPFGDFYTKIYSSSSHRLKELAQKGAKLNNITL